MKRGMRLLIPEKQNILKLDEISTGEKTAQVESKEKIVDDQTLLVPSIFENWKRSEGISW